MALSVSQVVNVTVSLSPVAAQGRNFGSLLIVGSSGVINTTERLRLYSSIDAVAQNFGTSAPEYAAAALFFSQAPQPTSVYIGEWAKTATAGTLNGAPLTLAEQAIAPFQAITTGGLTISFDGVSVPVTGINLSSATNLNAVAGLITTALTTHGSCVWDDTNDRFIIKSATTGVSSTVSVAAASPLAALLKVQATNNPILVAGIAAETLLTAVTKLADKSSDWYGLAVADAALAPADVVAVASFIEATGVSRIFAVTSTDTNEIVSGQTTTIGYQLKQLNLQRTFWQYSSTNPYAAVSAMGRAFTVDFSGSNTTITLKFKQEPGVVAEDLSTSQNAALAATNGNVFVKYNNATSILQQGVMANGYFFDEVHGLSWLQNDIQTAVYNLLYTSPKVPQTDAGINQIVGTINRRLDQAVNNGLVAPGQWNAAGFGALNEGDTLSSGYYTYAPKIATQSQADREARKSPLIQSAVKLAGAVHFANVAIVANR